MGAPSYGAAAPVEGRRPAWVKVAVAVVLLLALLVALCPVMLGPRRERARRASCLANVRSLCTNSLSYAADWGDRFPPRPKVMCERTVHGGLNVPNPVGSLAPYFPPDDWHRRYVGWVKSDAIYTCPSTRSIYSYQFNEELYGYLLSRVRNPGMTPMIYEAGLLSGQPGPHLKGYNVGFTDGHAAWLREPQVIAISPR